MCGIVGILSQNKDVAPLLVEGLRRLEYRGYDSAGIATLHDGKIERLRAEGKLGNLEAKLQKTPIQGFAGIGHTRWATHGGPTENNAHPHATARVAVVHNGIIENYVSLRDELQQDQYRFETETDTEVVAHLVDRNLKQGMKPQEAAMKAFDRLEGAYALALLFTGEDNLLIGVRQGTPLAVGYGEGEMYMASDSYALAPLTKKISFLEDGDRVVVTREGVTIYNKQGAVQSRPIRITAQSGATTGKGEYRHFMIKEIHEQPSVIGDTLNTFINPATGKITVPDNILQALDKAPRLTMVACGTAFYACMVGKYWFEKIARLPVEIDVASEFRYREAPMPENGVALFVSQSGETLDTLEALRYSKREKQTIMAIVNTIESTIERESDMVLHTLAGPEIGVASTKAFTTQLTTLLCMALGLAVKRGLIKGEAEAQMTESLRRLPAMVAEAIRATEKPIADIAREIADVHDVLYLGRSYLYPIALEGALKLKEISYIHAEGYAAGEMKHGPIALIDETVPVVVVSPGTDPLFEKTASNVQETVARGGQVLMITDAEGAAKLHAPARWRVTMNEAPIEFAPILYTIPVQLLAYHVAVAKGTDVDQPRNLAKSVTVE